MQITGNSSSPKTLIHKEIALWFYLCTLSLEVNLKADGSVDSWQWVSLGLSWQDPFFPLTWLILIIVSFVPIIFPNQVSSICCFSRSSLNVFIYSGILTYFIFWWCSIIKFFLFLFLIQMGFLEGGQVYIW